MSTNFDANKELDKKSTRIFLGILISIAFLILIVIIVYLSSNGQHNKVTYKGFENNIPFNIETPKNSDSNTINSNSYQSHLNDTPAIRAKSSETTVIYKSSNVNNGTNYGVIGNGNIINKPLKTQPNRILIDSLEYTIPNKATAIKFMISNSKYSKFYADSLISALKNDGYKIEVEQWLPATDWKDGFHRINSNDSSKQVFTIQID